MAKRVNVFTLSREHRVEHSLKRKMKSKEVPKITMQSRIFDLTNYKIKVDTGVTVRFAVRIGVGVGELGRGVAGGLKLPLPKKKENGERGLGRTRVPTTMAA